MNPNFKLCAIYGALIILTLGVEVILLLHTYNSYDFRIGDFLFFNRQRIDLINFFNPVTTSFTGLFDPYLHKDLLFFITDISKLFYLL